MIAPEELQNVSCGKLSVARLYGGCTFQGAEYVYDADADKLIRLDVHEARAKASRVEAKALANAERKKRTDAQEVLPF